MGLLQTVITVVNSLWFTGILYVCYVALGPKLIQRIKTRRWDASTTEILIARLNMTGTFLLLFTSVSAQGIVVFFAGIPLPLQASLLSPFLGLIPILLAHDMQIALLTLPPIAPEPASRVVDLLPLVSRLTRRQLLEVCHQRRGAVRVGN